MHRYYFRRLYTVSLSQMLLGSVISFVEANNKLKYSILLVLKCQNSWVRRILLNVLKIGFMFDKSEMIIGGITELSRPGFSIKP